jgi:Sec-independent protein translocase protein TatA
MDIYKIAFIELFLIAALGILIFGSKLKAFEYKATRWLRVARKANKAGITENSQGHTKSPAQY